MRQYKIFAVVIQVILLAQTIICGFDRTAQPASLIGRGFSGSAQRYFDHLLINPASVTDAQLFHTTVFYSPSPFQLPQLAKYGVLSGFDANEFSVAAGFHTFGFSLYRESNGVLSVGTTVSEGIHAGINFHLSYLSIERYGSSSTGIIDVGGLFSISDELSLGVALHNVSGAGFGGDDDIPRSLISGLSYRIDKSAILNADVVQEMRYPVSYRCGAEFLLHDYLSIRTGIQGESGQLFGGLSITVLPFRLDYALSSHPDLGHTHTIGIAIE